MDRSGDGSIEAQNVLSQPRKVVSEGDAVGDESHEESENEEVEEEDQDEGEETAGQSHVFLAAVKNEEVEKEVE